MYELRKVSHTHAFDNSEFHCVVCVHYRVLSFECSAYRRERSCLSSEEG